MTPELLRTTLGCSVERAEQFAGPLADACRFYEINTSARLAPFLATVGHESGGLQWLRELWGPTPAQRRYERDPAAPWPSSPAQAKLPAFAKNRLAYALGNDRPGDGSLFRGRGALQTTGRGNHVALRERLRARGVVCPDFEAEPQALEQPLWAAWSAADYWAWRGLNALADAGDFRALTKRVNGGFNGWDDRVARLERARAALAGAEPLAAPTPPPAPPEPAQEAAMPVHAMLLPFVQAGLAAALPKVAKMMEDDPAVVEVVATTVMEAVNAPTPVAAVEKIASDPAAAAAADAAVEANWYAIQRVHAESVDKARAHAMTYSQMKDVRTVAGRFTFIELLSLVMFATSWVGIGLIAAFDKVGKDTLENIVMLAAVASIVGVREFWMGSSFGSHKKDDRPAPKA